MNLDQAISEFNENGFVVIEDFLSASEVTRLKEEMDNIIKDFNPNENKTVFSCKDRKHANDYFMNSADKIRFFLEEDALDEDGNLIVEKKYSLNKIGHALHWQNPVFKEVTFSNKVKKLVEKLEFKNPTIVQGMYIFKNADRGGEVTPHQDATFLHTEPQRLVGLWFPLEDATEDNGCLWFQPGSHNGDLYARWSRLDEGKSQEMVFKDFSSNDPYNDKSKYVVAPAPKGSCVLIHGVVIHKSGKNTSSYPRPAYTFHVFDQKDTTYSRENWLQPTDSMPFPNLYEN